MRFEKYFREVAKFPQQQIVYPKITKRKKKQSYFYLSPLPTFTSQSRENSNEEGR